MTKKIQLPSSEFVEKMILSELQLEDGVSDVICSFNDYVTPIFEKVLLMPDGYSHIFKAVGLLNSIMQKYMIEYARLNPQLETPETFNLREFLNHEDTYMSSSIVIHANIDTTADAQSRVPGFGINIRDCKNFVKIQSVEAKNSDDYEYSIFKLNKLIDSLSQLRNFVIMNPPRNSRFKVTSIIQ